MGALGKWMSGSGFEEIIIEGDICASGPTAKVLSGKHYNRAIHVHQIVLDAVERLIIESFAVNNPQFEIPDLNLLVSQPSHYSVRDSIMSDDFVNFVLEYNKYKDANRNGKLGKTAQLGLMYRDSVWHLLRFHCAIKHYNIEQYMISMMNLCSLLFSADLIHYARFLAMQYYQLLTLQESRPGAVNLLHANGFSVARSNIPASCCAIDLTIEHIVNRSAKTTGGIVGFSRKPATYYK